MKLDFSHGSSGYVLYLVLVALSILGVLSSIVLLSLRGATQAVIIDQKKFQASLLAESGMARVEFFLNGGDNHDMQWETDSLFERLENTGDIVIACKHFGGYDKLTCTGTTGQASCTSIGIIGRNVPEILNPILTLTEDINGLVLDPTSNIQGTIVLDYGNVVRREGGGLKKLSAKGVTVLSPRKSSPLPFAAGPLDSVFERMKLISGHSQNTSFAHLSGTTFTKENDTVLHAQSIFVSGDCELHNILIENKTIIVQGSLTIGDNAECVLCTFVSKKTMVFGGLTRKCLFYSPQKQTITKGNHDSQFFCEDSIHIANTAKFSTSSLWVSRKSIGPDKVQQGGIQFDEAGAYCGCAICYDDSMERKNNKFRNVSISLGKQSSFKGFLITDGDIEIGGNRIEAQIWALKIVGKQNNQTKINEVIACSIKPLVMEIPFPLVGQSPVEVRNFYLSKEFEVKKVEKAQSGKGTK